MEIRTSQATIQSLPVFFIIAKKHKTRTLKANNVPSTMNPLYKYCLKKAENDEKKAQSLEKVYSQRLMVLGVDAVVALTGYSAPITLIFWVPIVALPNIRMIELWYLGWTTCTRCRRAKTPKHFDDDDFGKKCICSRCAGEVRDIHESIDRVQKGMAGLMDMVGVKVQMDREKSQAPISKPEPPKQKPPEPVTREFRGRAFHAPPLDEEQIARTINRPSSRPPV